MVISGAANLHCAQPFVGTIYYVTYYALARCREIPKVRLETLIKLGSQWPSSEMIGMASNETGRRAQIVQINETARDQRVL